MVGDLRAKLEARQKAKSEPLEGNQTRQTRSRGRKGLEALAGPDAFEQVGNV